MLTYRESLRDIETPRLSVARRVETLSHGLPPAGPANRRWLMPTKGATGVSMRRWPSGSSPRRGRCTSAKNWGWVVLTNCSTSAYQSVFHALGSTTRSLVPVGLSGVKRTSAVTTKAAVKMHTLARPAGATFRVFNPHASRDGKRARLHALDNCSCRKPEPSCTLPWIVATSTLPAFRTSVLQVRKPGSPSSSRVPSRGSSSMPLIASAVRRRRDDCCDRHHLRPDRSPWTASTPVRITLPNFCGASASRTRALWDESGKTLVFITNNFSGSSGRHHLRAPTKAASQAGTLLQSQWIRVTASSPHQDSSTSTSRRTR